MISFENDYSEGAHPLILQKFAETNMEQAVGYCNDQYCESAKEKIRESCACPEADVYFLMGGTQTNKIVVDTMLHIYEGVVAAQTGHVNMHESGAIEATGRKVLTIPQHQGKIEAHELEKYLTNFYKDVAYEHMVLPGMVYISQPTEYGTIYSLSELKCIHRTCKKFDLPLYIDGARLIYALSSKKADFSLADIAKYSDVFYVGGTKAGALCGEAVVFTKKNTPKHFISMVKRQGALLAKGRLLGIQFDVLFTDGLYKKIGLHCIEMAEKMKNILKHKGYEFFLESPTNQQFILLKNEDVTALQKKVRFSIWEYPDEMHTVARFATSWATQLEQIDELEKLL